MSISLVEVAGANFRTADEESDKLNTDFMRRLGMRKRYLPARLAISRSLAMTSSPPISVNNIDLGKVIKGDTLFGTGTTLSVWVALITERSGEQDSDIRNFIKLVAAHWQRGLNLLDEEWEQANQDIMKFVKRLVEISDLPFLDSGHSTPTFGSEMMSSSGQISVPIGEISEEATTKEKILWNLNGAGGSPHSAIMGGVGSGKTRTAVAMLHSIHAHSSTVPLIAFDFKGDLGTDTAGGGYHIDKLFGARTLEPPREPIPLDVLFLQSTEKIDIAEAASRFRESFARLKGSRLGDRQRTVIHEAATRVLSSQSPCELHHIRDALINAYEEHEMKEDGAISTMREICLFPLFQPEFNPASFFQQSWVIKLPPNVAKDSRDIVVNLILDALDQHLTSLVDAECSTDGTRGLRIMCMVDEAHWILKSKLPALSNLIRMSRSKGGAIMLISQSPDDFSGEDDEFLSEMGLVAAFSTNAPPKNAARILGKGANLGALQTGQCFVKLRGDQTTKKIRAWE